MGRKLPLDIGQQLSRRREEPQGFFIYGNKYGYRINISHPKIRPIYDRYLKQIGEPIPSDAQRHQFESMIMRLIASGQLRED